MLTERLYYTDAKLLEFDARVVAAEADGLILDRTAFYPTSGGQIFDTGYLESDSRRARVIAVAEDSEGRVLHRVESGGLFAAGTVLRGSVDASRRRDHMQQHTGQHLLSAVFIDLCHAPTVSFHMGEETCTIDLEAKSLSAEQLREVERRANEIVTDDVPVAIKFATVAEAKALGVRKMPPELADTLRLVEIQGHDLTACGGTHVGRSGEIGPILVRKTEKVKQGVRVEFVCGARAVAAARRDFDTLTAAAGLFSAHIHDVSEQIRKTLDESRAAGKREQKTLAELAEFMAARMLEEADAGAARVSDLGQSRVENPRHTRLVKYLFADRDMGFIKLLAQKLAAHPRVIALLACAAPQPSLVFAQSAGGPLDMGALMKEAMTMLGGRGGGTRDFAQGGAPPEADVALVADTVARKLSDSSMLE